MSRRVLLIILDGWGLAPAGVANAISMAHTPNFEYYWTKYPHTRLIASGDQVGLPKGQMGNSEVGHLNIGAGRVVTQDLPRITQSIKDKTFFNNKSLKSAFSYAKKQKKPVHLIGLLSDGGVHSHERHLYALMEMAKKEKVKDVYIHVFTDGRDVGPKTALGYIDKLEDRIKQIGIGKIASITGRYYAMDRDERWDRTSTAYKALTEGRGKGSKPKAAIRESYKKGVSDEFLKPVIVDARGQIKDGAAIIFFNLRSDRPRQLSEALVKPDFNGFERDKILSDLYFVTMTEYEKNLPVNGIAFPEHVVDNCLAEMISKHSLRQFHIAETEKYAHVTYFFNGGREKPFFGESRYLIPSPKVATYDMEPSMSAKKISDSLCQKIGEYDFMVVNFANLDMVGHTGNMLATVEACEVVDVCLGSVVKTAMAKKCEIVITADHGNAEKMLDVEGKPVTSHTTNKVPFILVNEEGFRLKDMKDAKLANIAPTVIDLMGLEKPKEMVELTLLKH
jgi:2,3-bisphosphoglycerate-independent phosphoglycerate mutase